MLMLCTLRAVWGFHVGFLFRSYNYYYYYILYILSKLLQKFTSCTNSINLIYFQICDKIALFAQNTNFILISKTEIVSFSEKCCC